jgi:hypothetical protein
MIVIIFPIPAAYPAPLVFALVACHVSATLVLLDGQSALRASLGSFHGGPSFVDLGLGLFAGHPRMPSETTSKAKGFLTLMTGYLSGAWCCLDLGVVTFGVGAILHIG